LREPVKRSQALGGLVLLLALAGAGVGLSFATPAHALEPSAAADTDTTPTTSTTPEPSPDPAPTPAPSKPKPVSKPAPKPVVHHSSTPVYRAPVHTTTTRSYTPTYTPKHATHTTPAVTHHTRKKHRRHVVAVPKPKPVPEVQVQPTTTTIPHINVGSPTAAVTNPTSGDSLGRALVLAGIGFAALLFLIVLAVPATAARFTAPGRVVIDHQTDLVLAGIATLLLTGLLFAVTGGGS
jgi:hypothetical protein